MFLREKKHRFLISKILSWIRSDKTKNHFSEIKKDFCDSLFHSNDSLFQKLKTAFQKIESWFHFSKAKVQKSKQRCRWFEARNRQTNIREKGKYFLALLCQIEIITYLCERFIYFKKRIWKQLSLSSVKTTSFEQDVCFSSLVQTSVK